MLTEIEYRSLHYPAQQKRMQLTDSADSYLEAGQSESLRWFWTLWKHYFASKEKCLALGQYRAVSLKLARRTRVAAESDNTHAGINADANVAADAAETAASATASAPQAAQ